MSVNKNTNGSVMVAALVVTLILGSLVGLFLKTVVQEVEYAHQARMAFQAVNMAEAWLEYAIFNVRSSAWNPTYWKKGSKG